VLIDWFTVGAQIVNFIVLVWLLKRFMYKPILNAIVTRERRISDELADASGQKAVAQTAREDLAGKNKAFDAERAALLARAVADAGREHERMVAESRNDLDALRIKQRALLQSEQAAQSTLMTRLIVDEVFAIARSALRDLAGTDLEDRMGEMLARRLREMSPETKDSWNAALRGSEAGIVVRSRFDLPASSRAIIQAAVNDQRSSDIPLRFEAASDSICGIEIVSQGQKISWTLGDYLEAFQLKVDALSQIGAAGMASGPSSPGSTSLEVARSPAPAALAAARRIPLAAAS
jgi:F-type H+-transporting ATPase subunit b